MHHRVALHRSLLQAIAQARAAGDGIVEAELRRIMMAMLLRSKQRLFSMQ